ncbi:hypothetical protein BLNAU_25011 [Blattamonas nauphoetae]|uniref:Uncharacterized protein n=1 Tax=Blattamonas nauphoetae TaxID=2049346 RepID=A0ABQ9WMT9_9EUKA|nr:hypothetical protein BLNAU_25011 [Blattamonas nauphoetae]
MDVQKEERKGANKDWDTLHLLVPHSLPHPPLFALHRLPQSHPLLPPFTADPPPVSVPIRDSCHRPSLPSKLKHQLLPSLLLSTSLSSSAPVSASASAVHSTWIATAPTLGVNEEDDVMCVWPEWSDCGHDVASGQIRCVRVLSIGLLAIVFASAASAQVIQQQSCPSIECGWVGFGEE